MWGFLTFPANNYCEGEKKMEHDAFMEVIDRLITGGMKELDALALVARMLQEESEEFIAIMKGIESERNPAKMN